MRQIIHRNRHITIASYTNEAQGAREVSDQVSAPSDSGTLKTWQRSTLCSCNSKDSRARTPGLKA